MPTVAVIQARTGSTRLPGKVLRPLGGRSVLAWVVRAAAHSTGVDLVVVATTHLPEDDAVAAEARACGAEVVRGPVDDVLARYAIAAQEHDGDTVVRLTADCPLLDPAVVAAALGAAGAGAADVVSTTRHRSLPRGLDVEVCTGAALLDAHERATGVERVHVTTHLYRHPERYRCLSLVFDPPADDLRVTLDEPDDGALLDAVVAELGDEPPRWGALVALLRARPDLVALNAHVRQKEVEEG